MVKFRQNRGGTALALTSLLAASPALSLAITYTFDYTGPTVVGTGQVTFDDSLLTPGNLYFGNTSNLTSFSAIFNGLPLVPGPTTTSFTKTDLAGWVLMLDGSSNIIDLNFFMNPPNVNGDGYGIQAVAPFTTDIYDSGSNIDTMTLSNLQSQAVPFEFNPSLGLMILFGLGGVKKGYQYLKSRKNQQNFL